MLHAPQGSEHPWDSLLVLSASNISLSIVRESVDCILHSKDAKSTKLQILIAVINATPLIKFMMGDVCSNLPIVKCLIEYLSALNARVDILLLRATAIQLQ